MVACCTYRRLIIMSQPFQKEKKEEDRKKEREKERRKQRKNGKTSHTKIYMFKNKFPERFSVKHAGEWANREK